MALTLSDAQKLTNDVILQGIIETVISESQVLALLPFIELQGSALTYNQENVLGSAEWYAPVTGTWTESVVTINQKTAVLRVLGGDADVDSFLQQTYRNPNDLKAEVIASKAKSVAYQFNSTFFFGNNSTNANQFDGIDRLCTVGQTVDLGANGATPTLDALDNLIDLIKPGKPEALMMSRRSRRSLKKLFRTSGNAFVTDVDQFGKRVEYYDNIPIIVDDNIPDTQTKGTSTNASTIFAVKFGAATGVCGITNGFIQYEEIGALETKNADRVRVKFYCGLVNFRDASLARMTGILPL
jgi:HK97 family phage major capsid protein